MKLLELENNQCRWIEGDVLFDLDWRYCGKPKLSGSSYCAEHAEIATPGLRLCRKSNAGAA